MPGIKEKVLRGSVWISAARLLVNSLTVLSTMVLSAYLTPGQFGIVFIAVSLLTVLASFTELSLSYSIIALKNIEDDHYYTAWTLGLIRNALLAVIFVTISPFVAHFYSEPDLVPIMAALSLSTVIGGMRSPFLVKLEKELSFHQFFYIEAAGSIFSFLISLLIAYLYQSYWAIVASHLTGAVIGVIVSYILAPMVPKFSMSKWRQLINFSVWLSLSQIVGILNYRVDQLVIGAYLGKTELGLYSVGGRLAQLPGREITRPLTATLFPAYSTVADDTEKLQSMYRRSQNVVFAVAFPITIGLALLADAAVRHLMGPSWVEVVFVVQVMALVTSIETLGTLGEPVAMAAGHTRLLLARDIQKFFIRVPLLLAGAMIGGFSGIVWARALAAVIGTTLDMLLVRRAISLGLIAQLTDNFRAIVSGMLMAVAVYLLRLEIPYPEEFSLFIVWLIFICSSGASLYILSSLVIWRLCGKPQGPETELIGVANSLLSLLKRR